MEQASVKKMINTEDLLDVTDQFDLRCYLHTDPDNGEKTIHLRITSEDGEADIGVELASFLKDKIIEKINND